MQKTEYNFSSGLQSLDDILKGIMAGDNVVWQVDDMADYSQFVYPYCRHIFAEKKPLIYFRFAQHPPLLPPGVTADQFDLDPQTGFEHFLLKIFNVIEKNGKGVYYLFDCLSGLAVDWFSDRMLANFFMLTCPYLYDYETVTYFVLLRSHHTPLAINAIYNTAQIVVDVYRNREETYILPLKVFERHSTTMYMLHHRVGDAFNPVLNSAELSEILSHIQQPWIDFNIDRKDTWIKTFVEAQKLLEQYKSKGSAGWLHDAIKHKLLKMSITRDDTLFKLSEKYFDIRDLISFGKRMIGTGLIGGKSVGMLLARAILIKQDPRWEKLLETHDSYFIGADIFYTYVIRNKCWWKKYKLKSSPRIFEEAEELQKKLLHGTFPEDIVEQFREMLQYFGQSPIIVRSSSLLEDAYGNAFSGKYESVFCTNQGTPEQRLENFIKAVQAVYASTLSRDALSYRMHRGLLDRDEQMALLVQRVSGGVYDHIYFPQIAGVGYSFNPYVWNTRIDPSKGVMRLVFGLGTRAVDRSDDDYTRVVALNAPLLRPEATYDEIRKYTQRNIDILDLNQHGQQTRDFEEVVGIAEELPLEIFASRDREIEERARTYNLQNVFPWILTFEHLLTRTRFVDDMRDMLATLSSAYQCPVDIEFCANFIGDEEYRINLLQCRPFQFTGGLQQVELPENIQTADIILKSRGPIIGQNTVKEINTIIYVAPDQYGTMPISNRYEVARLIGELANKKGAEANVMLVGPGRWGTKMPSLGIPVTFAAIRNVTALCEIVKMHDGLVPDISLGTHFFNDLVEMDILYITIFPDRADNIFNDKLFTACPNRLTTELPGTEKWQETIIVLDSHDIDWQAKSIIHVNTIKQEGVLFVDRGE